MEVLFQLLIEILVLAIRLQMVDGGGVELHVEKPVELSGEFHNELQTPVGPICIGEAMELLDIFLVLAVPIAEQVMWIGMKWAHLLQRLTTSIIASYPCAFRSSMMKSIEAMLQCSAEVGRR